MQQSVPAPTPILLWRSFESSPFSPLRSDSSAMPFNSAGGNRGVRRLCLWHCFVRQQGILCRSLGSESLEWYKEGEMHAQNSKFHFSFAQRLNSQNLSPTQPIQVRWVSQQILQQLPGWVCWVVFQSSWNEYTESANIQRTLNLSLVVRHCENLWDIERVCCDCTAGSRCTGHGALWKWTEPTEPIQCIWRLIVWFDSSWKVVMFCREIGLLVHGRSWLTDSFEVKSLPYTTRFIHFRHVPHTAQISSRYRCRCLKLMQINTEICLLLPKLITDSVLKGIIRMLSANIIGLCRTM